MIAKCLHLPSPTHLSRHPCRQSLRHPINKVLLKLQRSQRLPSHLLPRKLIGAALRLPKHLPRKFLSVTLLGSVLSSTIGLRKRSATRFKPSIDLNIFMMSNRWRTRTWVSPHLEHRVKRLLGVIVQSSFRSDLCSFFLHSK